MPRHPETQANLTSNEQLAEARKRLPSPSPSRRRRGLPMSREEFADAINRTISELFANLRNRRHLYVSSSWVGVMERGERRWTSDERRAALRAVTGATNDDELGLYPPRDRMIEQDDSDRLPEASSAPTSRGDAIDSWSSIGPVSPPKFVDVENRPPGGALADVNQPGKASDRKVATGAMLPSSNLRGVRAADKIDATHSEGLVTSITRSIGPDGDGAMLTVSVRLDGREVTVPLSRRYLLQVGVDAFLGAFASAKHSDMLLEAVERPGLTDRVTVTSAAHLDEIFDHLREQWHAQVKTDNLLGPRFALTSVLSNITVIDALRKTLRDDKRLTVVRLGAQYAESAAWLYEDSDDMAKARFWTSRAMQWAYEADDKRMLAWTTFRRSQQAAVTEDAAEVIGLARAARRDEEQLVPSMRAAIRVQEAYGYALDAEERTSQRLLDEAHTWAATDDVGDARGGHGSYCTPSYIEIQRANCWLATGRARRAISLYEDGLRGLPPVYQRNRAAAQSRLAIAYFADGQLEQAASAAQAALPAARSSGSRRIVREIECLSADLAPHRKLRSVGAFLDDLSQGQA